MQLEQTDLSGRIDAIIGHPMMVPAGQSRKNRNKDLGEEILPFDPYSVPDEVAEIVDPVASNEIEARDVSELLQDMLALFQEKAKDLPLCIPYLRIFASTRLQGSVMAADLPCGSWHCKRCGPKLKLKWYNKHVFHMGREEYLEKVYVDKEAWPSLHRKLNRRGENYLKYEQEDGRLLLITTAKLGGEEILPGRTREIELVKALVSTAFTKHPVSQSRRWSKSLEKPEKDKNWIPLDSCHYRMIGDLTAELDKMRIPWSQYTIYSKIFGSVDAVQFMVRKDYFQTLWKLGVLKRKQPSKGPRESRETQWIYT